jgi:hypothetical protein
MDPKIDRPKVFISYSWHPTTNKNWVESFAERLFSDGIHVIIDIWDISEGQDKYLFMEQMINNNEISKVLLICNKEYALKANQKKGGVGIESLIISSEIYENADQKKFIPIVREYDDNKPCLPIFINSRFYIDLSDEGAFEDNYEQLLRNIFNKPRSKRPPLGEPPAYIIEDNPIYLKTSHKLKPLKDALIKEKRNIHSYVNNYIESFISCLNDYRFPKEYVPQNNVDEEVLKKIREFKILRDDYLSFLNIYLSYTDDLEIDFFHNILERMIETVPEILSDGQYIYDQFRFFYYETFIYTITFLIKKNKYKEVGYILHQPFMVYNPSSSNVELQPFICFNSYIGSFEHRKKRLQLRRISLKADLVHEYSNKDFIFFEELIQTDLLLYVISCLNLNTSYYFPYWSPSLAVYTRNARIILIEKMISLKIFENMKYILNVKDIEDLKQKLENIKEKNVGVNSNFEYRIPNILSVIKIDNIGKIK